MHGERNKIMKLIETVVCRFLFLHQPNLIAYKNVKAAVAYLLTPSLRDLVDLIYV